MGWPASCKETKKNQLVGTIKDCECSYKNIRTPKPRKLWWATCQVPPFCWTSRWLHPLPPWFIFPWKFQKKHPGNYLESKYVFSPITKADLYNPTDRPFCVARAIRLNTFAIVMLPKKPSIDVVKSILETCLVVYPKSVFLQSLHEQYLQRGSLSKKQLQGLHAKAASVGNVSNAHLATLEAIILKKNSYHRSKPSVDSSNPSTIDLTEQRLADILQQYPQHKRIVFLQAKWNNNEPISASEKTEIERLHKLLVKPNWCFPATSDLPTPPAHSPPFAIEIFTYICSMTTELLKDMRDRILVLRRFLWRR